MRQTTGTRKSPDDNLVVVDVVSPFNPAKVFEKRFLDGASGLTGKGKAT